VEASAVPVVDAIAETYKEHLVGVTLHESGSHPPVTQTPAPPGRPPAFMTGRLAGSVIRTPGTGGGGVAEATVAPHTVYAATQEFGGVHAKSPGFMALWVRYIGYAGVKARGWLKHRVDIPARPYMSAAVGETIANGSLARAAMERFMAVVWGE
jgi:phage gpG-like protein